MTTPAELIKSGECTSACIAAITEPTRCTCPCRGTYHSVAAHAHIDGLLEARRNGLHLLSDRELIA